MKLKTASRLAGSVLYFVSGLIIADVYKQYGMDVAVAAGVVAVLTFCGSLLTQE